MRALISWRFGLSVGRPIFFFGGSENTSLLMGPFYSVALLILICHEKKVNKDSPKGRVSILSPLEPSLNDQRRCLWKQGEAPALVLFHTQARPACEAGV